VTQKNWLGKQLWWIERRSATAWKQKDISPWFSKRNKRCGDVIKSVHVSETVEMLTEKLVDIMDCLRSNDVQKLPIH